MEEKEQVEAVVDSYFREIFQSSHPSEGDIEQVLQALAPRLTEEAKQAFSQPFTDTEVHDAISSGPRWVPGSLLSEVLAYFRFQCYFLCA